MRLCCAAVKALLLASALLLPWLQADAAGSVRKYSFNLPAGEAEVALKRFAVQSGQQVLFPTDVVAGVQTNEVKGRYTMREALDRMLAGTSLFAMDDEATGAIAVARLTVPNRIIELPVYIVKETAAPNWRYAQLPGLEVIARCPDEATRMLLTQNHRLLQLLELIVPARFQVSSDVPTTYVLYGAQSQPLIAREIMAELEKQNPPASGEKKNATEADWSVRVLPNYRFWDQDSLAIFFILNESDFNKGRLTLTPSYVRYRLESRTPSLPTWFVEGLLELYHSVTLEPGVTDLSSADDAADESAAIFWPITWVSEAETQAVRKNPRQQRPLPPLAGLFAGNPDAAMNPADRVLWRAQAALLIRWALDDAKGIRQQALWKLTALASEQPVTEALFRDCFGEGYAEVSRQLTDYLPVAVKDSFKLPLDRKTALPDVVLRDATEGEVSRIKGDLKRLEIPYVRTQYPALAGLYTDQARRTLHVAYDKGDRDPRLLALLGLCECEAGNDAGARPFLEAAVGQGVIRPRAYYELARITFAELLAKKSTDNLTAAEAGQVLKPLAAARRQSPRLVEAYELIAEVWLRSDGHLTQKQLAVLDEGIRFFPRRTRLIYSAALLRATHGFGESALALTKRGLALAVEPAERERFEKLQAALQGEKK